MRQQLRTLQLQVLEISEGDLPGTPRQHAVEQPKILSSKCQLARRFGALAFC